MSQEVRRLLGNRLEAISILDRGDSTLLASVRTDNLDLAIFHRSLERLAVFGAVR